MTGIITRIPRTFSNLNLPTLVDYDHARIKDQILALPSLRAFYDFTDYSTMTDAGGGLISAVADISGNGFTATATGTGRPTFSGGAMIVADGLLFNGTNKLVAANLFSGSSQLSVAAGLYAVGTDGASRMYLSDASMATGNFYFGAKNQWRSHQADVVLDVADISTRRTSVISTMDSATNALHLYADGLIGTGTLARAAPSGDANIGSWHDAVTTSRYIGVMGHLAVFTEDLSANDTARELVLEYARRRYRIAA